MTLANHVLKILIYNGSLWEFRVKSCHRVCSAVNAGHTENQDKMRCSTNIRLILGCYKSKPLSTAWFMLGNYKLLRANPYMVQKGLLQNVAQMMLKNIYINLKPLQITVVMLSSSPFVLANCLLQVTTRNLATKIILLPRPT